MVSPLPDDDLAPGAPNRRSGARRPGSVVHRIALGISVALIVAQWGFTIWMHFFGSEPGPVPTSVWQLTVFVMISTAILVGVTWLLMRASGERLVDLGFRIADFRRAAIRGTLIAAGLFVLINVGLNSILAQVVPREETTVVADLFRNPLEVPLWIICAVIGGGFREELARAFVLTRCERVFGRVGLVIALLVDSFVFGAGHLYQGTAGAISAGTMGFLMGLLFLRRRRVADAMVAHAMFDLFGVAVAYAMYA